MPRKFEPNEHIEIRSTDRVTIAGLPGTGKTTLAKYLASLCEPNILIYDPLSQYDGFTEEQRYIPKSDSLTEFDSVCRRLRQRGDITFLVEEAERYLGQGKPLGENAFDLINRGRNWGVGVFAVTRRIQRISKDFFDLCQCCFFFRCGLKSREYIADLTGWDTVRDIMSLPLYNFVYYNVETEEYGIRVLKLGTRPSVEGMKERKPVAEMKKPSKTKEAQGVNKEV